jgi:hypothetical protein
MYNRLILVAGSGRSGTSLMSGVLKTMGCHVPQPEVEADGTNPRGFGEPRWVVDFHSRLLKEAGVETSDARPGAWARTAEIGRDAALKAELEAWLRNEFRQNDHVVIKDPRLLWFIPTWNRVGETMAAPCYVTMLRHPLEVIKSKQTYYGGVWHANARVAGWLNTMLYTERATRGNRRSLVRYEDLLTDAMVVLSRVSEELDLALVERATPQQMRAAAKLADPSLRRATATWDSMGVDGPLVELAEAVWDRFDSAAKSDEGLHDPSVQSDLDSLRQRYVDLYSLAESTAQASVLAAAKGQSLAGRKSQASSGATSLRKLARKARRKGRRALHKLRAEDAPGQNPPG